MLETPVPENNFERNYPSLVTLLASMTSSSSSIIDENIVFLKEIQRVAILKEWGSTILIFVSSNTLNINIRQVYPDLKEKVGQIPYKILNSKINSLSRN